MRLLFCEPKTSGLRYSESFHFNKSLIVFRLCLIYSQLQDANVLNVFSFVTFYTVFIQFFVSNDTLFESFFVTNDTLFDLHEALRATRMLRQNTIERLG